MIKIEKGTAPKEWTEIRNSGKRRFTSIPALRAALLKEQGHLCAYCMRRLAELGENQTGNCRVEHWLCREQHPERELDYQNLLLCCNGDINEDAHCDNSKADKPLTFSPLRQECIDSIGYGWGNGYIKSDNPQWNKELNEVLNLNNKLLAANRKMVMEGVLAVLARGIKRKDIDRRSKLTDDEGKRIPWCGVIEWMTRK